MSSKLARTSAKTCNVKGTENSGMAIRAAIAVTAVIKSGGVIIARFKCSPATLAVL